MVAIDSQGSGLQFAARPAVVLRYLGELMLFYSPLLMVPACVCAAAGEWLRFAVYLSIAAPLAIWGARAHRQPDTRILQKNEALAIAALAFVLGALASCIPLMTYGLSPIDAWFEAVSGITTTGFSVLPSVSEAPFELHFARAWLQWSGGIGVLGLALAFTVSPQAAAAMKGDREDRGPEDIVGSTRAHMRNVLIIYLFITIAGCALLAATGMGLSASVLYVLAAISTGGFSPADDSLAALDGGGQVFVVMAISALGALPFTTIFLLRFGKFREVLSNPQIRWFFGLACAATALLLFLEDRNVADLLLLSVSAQSTTGFSTVGPAELLPASQLVLIAAMVIGGASGSTAGGLKIDRLLSIGRHVRTLILRLESTRHSMIGLRNGREAGHASDRTSGVIAVTTLYFVLIGLSWFALVAAGYPALAALFESVSAASTVGLSMNVAGPELDTLSKLLLSGAMLMGRLEIVALLILFVPGTWFGKRRNAP